MASLRELEREQNLQLIGPRRKPIRSISGFGGIAADK